MFLDHVSIPAGSDFGEHLLRGARRASALLAVIGADWLGLTGPDGCRRIDDPADWVRRELAAAFSAGVRVIPVLTDGSTLPGRRDLPDDIAALNGCQFRRLRHDDAAADLDRIAADLATTDPNSPPRPADEPAAALAAERVAPFIRHSGNGGAPRRPGRNPPIGRHIRETGRR